MKALRPQPNNLTLVIEESKLKYIGRALSKKNILFQIFRRKRSFEKYFYFAASCQPLLHTTPKKSKGSSEEGEIVNYLLPPSSMLNMGWHHCHSSIFRSIKVREENTISSFQLY